MWSTAVFRSVRPGDAKPLSDLAFRSKAHWGYDRAFMAACRAELAVTAADIAASAASYLREASGKPLGFYSLVRLAPDRLELDRLFVDPEAIGAGHGAALMRHAITTAHGLGASTIEVQSDPHAVPFYRAMGAALVGERASESIPGRVLPVLSFSV